MTWLRRQLIRELLPVVELMSGWCWIAFWAGRDGARYWACCVRCNPALRESDEGAATMSAPDTSRTDGEPQPAGAGKSGKKKFGLVLQGAASLGAYEVGAIEYLYDIGMECAIVAGASSGAMNAVTLAGAKEYPPRVLRKLWVEMFPADPPIPFLPPIVRQFWSMFGVPHMYEPRLDYWNIANWTYVSDPSPLKKTLLDLLDWDQVRDSEHMRLFVSASGVENGETAYFNNLPPEKLPGPEYPPGPFGVEHVLASGSFPFGFPWTGQAPRLLGRRPDRQYPAQAGHR